MMNSMLLGAVAMACFTASLFFLRFWKTTRDRFFLFFAISFSVEGINRIILGLFYSDEQEPRIYLLRLVAFLLILFAIVDKNRAGPPRAE
ncbi:MAG: hypothetical protein J0L97_02665 [Alphaproteobacteria bacterium]|nr:hypothetical protein [Alphaproteobacteria bacterium]